MVTLKNQQRTCSIYEFAKLAPDTQIECLRTCGILLDTDFEGDRFIHLYFLNGFFVEVTVSPDKNNTIEIVPFRQGYRIESYFHEKTVLVPKRHKVAEGPVKNVFAIVPCLN